MCNHYSADQRIFDFMRVMRRKLKLPDPLPTARGNIYPKFPAAIVMQERGESSVIEIRWGVWPFYAKDKPQYITNARADGLLTKTTWRQSTRHRRCLIPGTGYFEPGLGPVGARGEVIFTVKERPVFFFAGLWDTDPDDSGTRAFTMVTTEPNEYVRPFHDRMPVVLSDEDAERWIGEEPLSDADLAELCRGLPSEALLHEEIAAKPARLTIKRPGRQQPPDDQLTLF
jgi:putative SOS response-associated peptidase YedK